MVPALAGGMNKEELQERSLRFAIEVRQLSMKVRASPGGRGTADQLLSCATSVGANYRSACRARSRAEFIAKLGIVVEECDESVYWLEFIERSDLLPAGELTSCLDEARQLRAIFAASYGTARANHRRTRS
jgi:four helix bundle protein